MVMVTVGALTYSILLFWFYDVGMLLLSSSSFNNIFIYPKPAPPKVTNLKIIGDLRENSKVTATGIVTGGTEGSSRVQWYKTSSSTLDGENGLEALSTSKIAKVCDPISFEHINSVILRLTCFHMQCKLSIDGTFV